MPFLHLRLDAHCAQGVLENHQQVKQYAAITYSGDHQGPACNPCYRSTVAASKGKVGSPALKVFQLSQVRSLGGCGADDASGF